MLIGILLLVIGIWDWIEIGLVILTMKGFLQTDWFEIIFMEDEDLNCRITIATFLKIKFLDMFEI